MTSPRRGFASDNAATVHPAVLERLATVNVGHAFGYGHDPYTTAVAARVAETLGGAEAFFVFNGSGANVVSLRAACRPWEAVICSDWAHINTDESGAPEVVGGLKLLPVASVEGRLHLEAIEPLLWRKGDEHQVQPRVLSVTQSTELGTLYGLDELRALMAYAHGVGLLVHLDGARLANAAAALGVPLAEVVQGADVVSFGGTKNGLMGAEAIVVMNPELLPGMPWLRKQSLQLASKMRFLAAQFEALLDDDLWLANAWHANAMAARLQAGIEGFSDVALTRAAEANAVFAVVPEIVREKLLEQFDFYTWDDTTGEVRWMCSWDTTPDDVDGFVAALGGLTVPR